MRVFVRAITRHHQLVDGHKTEDLPLSVRRYTTILLVTLFAPLHLYLS